MSAGALLWELLPESQGQCPALEKGTGEHFHLVSQAPPQEGAFPGHELASVLVGSGSCTSDLKVTLANAGGAGGCLLSLKAEQKAPVLLLRL